MLIRALGLALSVSLMLAHANADTSGSQEQQAGSAAKDSSLMKSCAKECPNATTNEDALKCAEKMEKSQGEATFKKKHRSCYSAHEKYEKKTGHEEAGEKAGEEAEES